MKAKHTSKLKRAVRRYEYRVTSPMLPPGSKSPVMDHKQMEWWLNDMDAQGWEFVGYAEKHWHQSPVQSWWIFRRLCLEEKQGEP